MKVILAIVFFSAMAINAEEIVLGSCPLSPSIDDFDPTKISGDWHEITKTEVHFEPYGFSNVKSEFSFSSNGDLYWHLKAKAVIAGILDLTIVGERTNQSNVFIINVENEVSTLTILDTDYKTYAVVMACKTAIKDLTLRDGWILGRKSALSRPIIDKALKTLSEYGLSRDAFDLEVEIEWS